jgi:hypothetical protein
MEFVTLYRPHRANGRTERQATLEPASGGYVLTAAIPDGELTALLPADGKAVLTSRGMASQATIKLKLEQSGHAAQIIELREDIAR